MRTHGLFGYATAIFLSLMPPTSAALAAGGLPPVLEDTLGRDRSLVELARLAVAGDDTAAQAAQDRLRAAGPEGLRAFERAHGPALDAAREAITAAADAPLDQRDPAGLGEPARA